MSTQSGPFGWLSPAIAAITIHDPEFLQFAIALDGGQLHLLGLLLSHADTHGWSAAEWQAFGCAFRTESGRTLIARFAQLPPALLNVTGKLKGTLWRPATYRRLGTLAREHNARKWLAHAVIIAPADLIVLSRLPPAFRTPKIVGAARHRRQLSELRYRIAIARRLLPGQSDRVLARVIEQKGVKTQYWKFIEGLLERVDFPTPPWAGDEALRPVRSYQELAAAAVRLRNCLRDRLAHILAGNSAIYLYCAEGELAGAVEIGRHAIFGWEFEEMAGPDNNVLSAAHQRDVLRRLQAAGISAGRDLPFAPKDLIA